MKTLILILLPITILAQIWTDPINISPNMPGLDNQPDLCIDKNGTLHCVFTHKLDINWRKIYYSKSTDDGLTWTTPEDISLNSDTSLMHPHIVADTNNILYVSYDYNTGNPAMTMIYLKTFDGIQWSEPFIVSEGFYNSDHNQLVIDNNDRLYCFWYREQKSYYRYYEEQTWSEVIIPYINEYCWLIGAVVIDHKNNLHCAGAYLDEGQPVTKIKVIYFEYLIDENFWTDKTIISNETYLGANNLDIDINNLSYPYVDYRQKTENTGQYSDSTMYTFNNGAYWTEPELIVNDPYEQRIAIDLYNQIHIIDREKLETGSKLVHYQKYGSFWQGYIIDTAENSVGMPSFLKSDYFLYLVYTHSAEINNGDIYFTKYDIVTGSNPVQNSFINPMGIYPNPFNTQTTIEFTTNREQHINVSIYNLNGEHIKTLMNKNTVRGEYRLIWNGKGKNGKEDSVIPGLYLVRLQSGRKIVTKAVEYIK